VEDERLHIALLMLDLSNSGIAAPPRETELDAGETHQSRLWIVFAFIPMRTYA
jgi:hypothetical protein